MLWSALGSGVVLAGPENADYAAPEAINASGWSAGIAYTEGGSRFFAPVATPCCGRRWDKATVLRGVSRSPIELEALAINDSGESVEFSVTENNNYRISSLLRDAVVEVRAKRPWVADILGPNWSETVATAINKAGDITGHGDYQGILAAFYC